MKRKSAAPAPPAPTALLPSEQHAALALREATPLLQPLVRWLLRSGVRHGVLVELLKRVYVDVARAEIERAHAAPTQSAISVLSGVHRKDVRNLFDAAPAVPPRQAVPLASQVYTRWLTDRRYRQRDGTPKPLPRKGSGASFERLARELSNDVHPRAVLDELLRLGVVQLDGELVVPVATAFMPSQQLDTLTALLAANVGDHLAGAVHNLSVGPPGWLEQSVFADGLSATSVAELQRFGQQAWATAFETMVREATVRVERDNDLPPHEAQRMRFGVYFYAEPTAAGPAADAATVKAPRPRRRRKAT